MGLSNHYRISLLIYIEKWTLKVEIQLFLKLI